jgi:glutathione S-transferase
MQIFRPIMFPRFQGKESDLETARKGWNETLPPHFDYLEKTLDGREFFVGDRFSIADIAVGAQMAQLDLVAGTPDAGRWPSLVKHTEAMKVRPGFAENLAVCSKMLRQVLPEKVDLSR